MTEDYMTELASRADVLPFWFLPKRRFYLINIAFARFLRYAKPTMVFLLNVENRERPMQWLR